MPCSAHRSCGGVRRAAPSARPLELANRESRASWKDLSAALKRRGLSGVEYVVSDDHAGRRVDKSLRDICFCVLGRRPSDNGQLHFGRGKV
ncbi:MAG: hypothetical protein DLM68_09390 [Hyphomicrobiales bacterium]|nr:MAG: hypothetical protein DLM68_09390 [Hyphomicrobiales bacterium]